MTDIMQWFDDIKDTAGYVADHAKLDFAADIERHMESIGMTRSELAAKIGHAPSYITKVLRGDANLTIESMAKLSHALGCKLSIHVADNKAKTRWFDLHDNTYHASISTVAVQAETSAAASRFWIQTQNEKARTVSYR